MECPLCKEAGGGVLWRDARCRVVVVDDDLRYPGFCRVIWNSHVREMTDLDAQDQDRLMRVVFGVERALRALVAPAKINLASLGNKVPHLHWHVIPRFSDDAHFPATVWDDPLREGVPHSVNRDALRAQLMALLGASSSHR